MTESTTDPTDALCGLPLVDHPRPLLRRESWWSLDGEWDFALDVHRTFEHPAEVTFDRRIRVPFAPETERSGIDHKGYIRACWYRRTVQVPPLSAGERLLLHFGAVDHEATVWIDDALVVRHEGGYSSFTADVTRELSAPGEHELTVLAVDEPLDLAKPRGKQDWEQVPHSIWYHRTTGIWQTVWLERVGPTYIDQLQWHTSLDRLEVTAEVRLAGEVTEELHLDVCLLGAGRLLVDDTVGVFPGQKRLARGFRLDATGLDHLRESLMWSPERPTLVEARLQLRQPGGRLVDSVHSYTAIRTVGTRAGRFLLNGRPYPLRLVLDQGYWHDSGLTPPDDQALRRDVELVKAMGFNGVRKHQKIEDPRFLHWADRLGLLVWEEMPPAYQFDTLAIRRMTDEWIRAVERDRSHPCVVAWVPFNESTGLLDLSSRSDEQQWVVALTALTKALDPTRPVVSNDGWETLGGDIIAVHDYEQDTERLVERWNGDLRHALLGYASHHRLQTLDEDGDDWVDGRPERPVVLTEFGGIGWLPEAEMPGDDELPEEVAHDRLSQPAAWGYATVATVEEYESAFVQMMDAVHRIEGLAGFCYTQLADTYQEINGLLTADRRPKLPVEVIARATRGRHVSYFDPLKLV